MTIARKLADEFFYLIRYDRRRFFAAKLWMFFLEFRLVTISPSERIESSAAQAIARLAMQRTAVQAPIKNLVSLVRQRRNFDPRVDMQSISDHLFFSKSLRGHAATARILSFLTFSRFSPTLIRPGIPVALSRMRAERLCRDRNIGLSNKEG